MEYNVFHMKVLMVRHGESDSNASKTFTHDPNLTERGHLQSIRVGKRLAKLKVEAIYSSPLRRAIDTASVIATDHSCPIIKSSTLVERVRPSRMFGMTRGTPEYMRIHDAYSDSFAAGRTFEDGESYKQIVQRVCDAQSIVIKPIDGTVVVVSHGYFIRTFIGRVLFGERLSSTLLSDMRHHFRTINTGITEFEVADGKWKLICVNDYSHLPSDLVSYTD